MPRLSVEQAKMSIGKNIQRGGYYTYSGEIILNLLDTIEAQHDEIESLKNWNACEEEEEHKKLIELKKRSIELEDLEKFVKEWRIHK